jgi:hypothetical protein
VGAKVTKEEKKARSTLKQETEQEDDLLALEGRDNCEIEALDRSSPFFPWFVLGTLFLKPFRLPPFQSVCL